MPESVKVSVRDAAIRIQRAGKGPPVLFLHGPEGVTKWLPFFDTIAAAGYEVLVPDHPAFGLSDDPPWVRNVPDLAMFYLELLEQLEFNGIHLVGHSLGGWIAAEIAVRDRARLKSLTLIAAAGIRVSGIPPGDFFIWNPDEAVRNCYVDQSFADAALAILLTDDEREMVLRNRFAAAKYCWQPRLFNPDLEKWLHRIKLAALVMWGRNDKIFPPEYADLWMKRLPAAELAMFERCGHLPFIEKQDEVAARITAFLRKAVA